MTAVLFVMTVCAEALLLLAQYPLRRKRSAASALICFAVKAVLLCAASLCILVLDTWASWHLGLLTTAVYIALGADLLADVCRGVVRLLRRMRKKDARSPYKRTVILTACLCVALFVCGSVNEKRSAVTTYTLRSEKLSRPYTVVFISDIHFGDPNEPDRLRRNVDTINAAQPDIVILGGDVTDDFSSRAEMEEAYSILGELNADTYFIFGNHDRQAHAFLANGAKYSEAELIEVIEANGITVLRDEAVPIGGELILIGREDESRPEGRKALNAIAGADDRSRFRLIADHQPYDTEELGDFGAELQLSGHSHAGQLFPNRWLMHLEGYNVYGQDNIGQTVLLVSSGEGVWHTPFRTEAHSEIMIVELLPAA